MSRSPVSFVLVAFLLCGCEAARRAERVPPPPVAAATAAVTPFVERAGSLGSPRGKHAGTIRCAAFAPDGERAITGGDDRALRLWDLATGDELGTWPAGRISGASAVAFASDRHVLVGGGDGSLALRDLAKGNAYDDIELRDAYGPVLSIGVGDRGRRALVAHGGSLVLLDVVRLRHRPLELPPEVTVVAAALSSDGRVAVALTEEPRALVFDADAGTLRHAIRLARPARAVAVTADRIAVGHDDGTLSVFDRFGLVLQSARVHEGTVLAVAITPDARVAVTASWEGALRLLDLESGRPLAELADPEVAPLGFQRDPDAGAALALSPDGRRALLAGRDQTFQLWDLAEERPLHHWLAGHRDQVRALAVTTEGVLLSASDDRSLRTWDAADGRALANLHGHLEGVSAVALLPDERRALSTGDDGAVLVWDLERRRPLARLGAHEARARALALSPDGARALTGGDDHAAFLWDVRRRRRIARLPEHPQAVTAVAFARGGAWAVTGCADGNLRVFDLGNLRSTPRVLEHGHLDAVTCLATLGDRFALSGGQDGRVVAWNLETGFHRSVQGPGASVRALAHSPDGRAVAAAGGDGTIHAFRMETGRELARLQLARGDFARSLAFSRDGARLYAGTARGPILELRVARLPDR